MGIDDIRISLDKVPVNGFMPGTNILGKIVVKVGKRKHIKDLNVTLQGKASVKFRTHEVRWFLKQHSHSREGFGFPLIDSVNLLNGIHFLRRLSESGTFKAEQYFANTSHSLIVDSHLEHGDNVFPFCLPLLENLPPSFSCEDGSIRYKLKVRKKSHTLFKTEFQVINSDTCKLSTHLNPAFNDPVKYEDSLELSQFFSPNKFVLLSLSLPKSHFFVNEKFNIVLEINNTLSLKISSVTVSLGVVILCAGKHNGFKNVKKQHDVISEISCGNMEKGEIKSWTLPFTVHNSSISNLDCCSIIRVYNTIGVTIKPDCMFSNSRSLQFFAPIKVLSLPQSTAPVPESNAASTSSSSIQPPAFGFIFQPSDPASAPPYPDDYDPPPPYPGTPPALADKINELRLS